MAASAVQFEESVDNGSGFAEDKVSNAPKQTQRFDRDDEKYYDSDLMKKEVVDNIWEALHEVDVKLADKQADASSPLYSVKTFEELGLDENLLKGIYAMKFQRPSKVQEKALPLLLSNPPTNLIGQSQSGTGKTAAFVLAMLSRIETSNPSPQAICLAPTRELARQIHDVATQMGQYTDRQITLASREATPRSHGTKVTGHVIIGTPGTILDLIRRQMLDLSGIRVVVLDEADTMLDQQGMGVQSLRVVHACPSEAQRIFFSATFTEQIIDFAHQIAPNANQFTLKRDELSLEGIRQYCMDCMSFAQKFEMLSAIYGLLTISQSIIFVATRATAEQVQAHMQAEGHRTSLLHGGQTVQERDEVIDQFRRGVTKVLISTNVLARGIDILQVSLVINFDLPMTLDREPDFETYLHRIGRTGRFGRTGVAINFVHNRHSMEVMKAFEKYFGRSIIFLPKDSLESIEARLNEGK